MCTHSYAKTHLCLCLNTHIFLFFLLSCFHVNTHTHHCGSTDTPGQHLPAWEQTDPPLKAHTHTHLTLNRKGGEDVCMCVCVCSTCPYTHTHMPSQTLRCRHTHSCTLHRSRSNSSTTEENVSAQDVRTGLELPLLLNEHVGRLVHPPAPHVSLFLLPPLHFFFFLTLRLGVFPAP